MRRLRGGVAGMVFQEPMTSLNPLQRISRQVGEAVMLHRPLGRVALRARVITLLHQAGFADAESRLDAWPHQLSGGQRQRVMIAMALANDPALLIADEPTTALDVTIQAQILKLLAAQKVARGLALLLISHDLSIVRRYADRVCVMREGRVVEAGRVAEVFAGPEHPYTRMLLAAEPKGEPVPVPAAAPVVLESRDAARWGTCGRWTGFPSPCMPARRSGWWARAVRASPPWASPCSDWSTPAGRSASTATSWPGWTGTACAGSGRACRSCSRTRTAACRRA
jgi:ABC-type microcin C transport system duplicated ATPase subunit YejF